MRKVSSVQAMQRLALGWRRQGTRVGLVPTMGYLHAGHLSLIHRARKAVGVKGKVVVSLYVNPTQFAPQEDFSKYPRDFARDARLCRSAGVDIIFAPADEQMYPKTPGGAFSTYVTEESLSRPMEGASRPTHFRGVTTVVAKLFNIVQPDVAVFGAKDWQQASVIRRMVRDLNFPVRIEVAPIVREPDGLAMSSRNRYLAGDLHRQGLALHGAILQAQQMVRAARKIPAGLLRQKLTAQIQSQPAARVDYIEFFHPGTLLPVAEVTRGTQMALAVFIGHTRLIDNARL
jgi:pantoate--beta-alanine ligase